jgi:5'(3')-deoxyribonucleotidase
MKKKVTVFLDMDGVLVDWLNGIRQYLKKPPEFYDCFRQDPSSLSFKAVDDLYGGREILKKEVEARPVQFWFDLEIFPWTDYLVKELSNEFKLAFLTKPGKYPNAAAAKLLWQLKHYPDVPLVMASDKYLVASETKVLIDDDDWQLTRFDLAGGLAVKWPSQFELEKQNLNLYVKPYIQSIIKLIKEYEIKLNN